MNEHPKASAIPLDITQLQNLEQLRDDEFWDYARWPARFPRLHSLKII